MSHDVTRLLRCASAAHARLRKPGGPGVPRRVAMLSVHTSPLHQPGTGDAGGMNIYMVELAKRLAAIDIEVEIFTRATAGDLPPVVDLAPGVLVRHVDAGPYEGLPKEALAAQLCAFTHGMTQAWASYGPGHYDLVHSHYWLSGQVGWLAAERWGVPLVHAMHTMAKVKNAALAEGDTPEPTARVIGETQIVSAADRLIANTAEEAAELVHHYAADPHKVAVVHPGVNLDVFRPFPQHPDRSGPTAEVAANGAATGAANGAAHGPTAESTTARAAAETAAARAAARARLGLPQDALIPLFAGRIQPLKGPDVLLRAVGELLTERPELRSRIVVPVVGGPSGTGLAKPERLHKLAALLGITDVVQFRPPVRQEQLADWFRAASVLVMPSYSESFGLVAIEAQAAGTPVLAAAVGGLPVAVRNGVTGFLVDGHEPARYARVLRDFADDPALPDRMGAAAAQHATAFGWGTAAARTADVYAAALHDHHQRRACAAS